MSSRSSTWFSMMPLCTTATPPETCGWALCSEGFAIASPSACGRCPSRPAASELSASPGAETCRRAAAQRCRARPPRAVVAAVLEPPQPLQQDGGVLPTYPMMPHGLRLDVKWFVGGPRGPQESDAWGAFLAPTGGGQRLRNGGCAATGRDSGASGAAAAPEQRGERGERGEGGGRQGGGGSCSRSRPTIPPTKPPPPSLEDAASPVASASGRRHGARRRGPARVRGLGRVGRGRRRRVSRRGRRDPWAAVRQGTPPASGVAASQCGARHHRLAGGDAGAAAVAARAGAVVDARACRKGEIPLPPTQMPPDAQSPGWLTAARRTAPSRTGRASSNTRPEPRVPARARIPQGARLRA